MKQVTYLAILEPTKTGYSIYFPDVPGCISVAGDINEATKNAKEALELHYYGTIKDGEEFPKPNQQVKKEEAEGNLVCPITILPELVIERFNNRKVKTNCVLPAWLKEIAEENHINYSQLLESAIKNKLGIV